MARNLMTPSSHIKFIAAAATGRMMGRRRLKESIFVSANVNSDMMGHTH